MIVSISKASKDIIRLGGWRRNNRLFIKISYKHLFNGCIMQEKIEDAIYESKNFHMHVYLYT